MQNDRQNKIAQLLVELASAFINEHSNRQSLITVTRANVSPDLRNATVFVGILPEDKEEPGMLFLQRNAHLFRDFLKQKTDLRRIPFLTFTLDLGEKNRQRLDEISRHIHEE